MSSNQADHAQQEDLSADDPFGGAEIQVTGDGRPIINRNSQAPAYRIGDTVYLAASGQGPYLIQNVISTSNPPRYQLCFSDGTPVSGGAQVGQSELRR